MTPREKIEDDKRMAAARREGVIEGLEFAVQVTMDADCCCRCQDDISAEIERLRAKGV